MHTPFPLVAVDIGNSRMKLGLFVRPWLDGLPEPDSTLHLTGDEPDLDLLGRDLLMRTRGRVSWWIGSVNRPLSSRLTDWLHAHRPEDRVTLLASGDLPLRVAVERPDMVGIDRLLDAVAANQLRQPGRPAIVIDMGSAITLNLISQDGNFRGGAILPGIGMAARAMHAFTDLLPLVDLNELAAPPAPLGTATVPAMESGLFWGAVGAIRELIRRLVGEDANRVDVFLTGGAAPALAHVLSDTARYVPHLTLAGIALAAARAENPK